MMYGEGEPNIDPGMPRGYRTPELVDHLNGNGPLPTTGSDVFQLGLVLGELFSGENPLALCGKLTAPIVLRNMPALPPEISPMLPDLLKAMLRTDPCHRPSAERLLNAMLGLLDSEVRRDAVLQT